MKVFITPRPVYCRETRRTYPSAQAAGRAIKGTVKRAGSVISDAARATFQGKSNTAYGFHWAYVDQIPKAWLEELWSKQPAALARTKQPAASAREKQPANKKPVVRNDGMRYDSIFHAAMVVHVQPRSVSSAAKSTEFGAYSKAGGFQWVFAKLYDSPGFKWPRPSEPTKRNARPVVRSDGEKYESMAAAARAVGCTSSTINTAIQQTSHGVCYHKQGYQWASLQTYNTSGFEWPVLNPLDIVRSDGKEYLSASSAALAVGTKASMIYKAISLTAIGERCFKGGHQWAYRKMIEKPGFKWPSNPRGSSIHDGSITA